MKKIISLMLALVMVFLLIGCQSEQVKLNDESRDNSAEKSEMPESVNIDVTPYSGNDKLSGSLNISSKYVMTDDSILGLARGFMELHPDVEIIVDGEFTEENGITSVEEMFIRDAAYSTKVVPKLLSGEIDIMNLSSTLNYEKYVESGTFINLLSLWENDPEIVKEDYFENIIEAAKYREGLFYIPTLITLGDKVYINKLALEDSDFDIDIEKIKLTELLDLYLELMEDGKIPEKFYFQYDDTGKNFKFDTVIQSDYFDFENKICNFDSQEFIDYLEKSNKIYTKKKEEFATVSASSRFDFEKANNSLFMSSNSMIQEISDEYNNIFDDRKKSTKAISLTNNSGKSAVIAADAIAITSSCKDPALAWEFIKYCIIESPEVAYGKDSGKWNGDRFSRGFVPINKNNLEKYLEAYYRSEYDEKMYTESVKSVESVEKITIAGTDLSFKDIFVKYYDQGIITAEECAKEIQNRAEIYLKE